MLTPPLAAADSELTQEYLTCMDKSGGITAEMIECTNAETARQDARLNENYKRLMSNLSAKRKKMLLEVQRAWIKFRHANCYDPAGGPPRSWPATVVFYRQQLIAPKN